MGPWLVILGIVAVGLLVGLIAFRPRSKDRRERGRESDDGNYTAGGQDSGSSESSGGGGGGGD